jgi:hypothetical protein
MLAGDTSKKRTTPTAAAQKRNTLYFKKKILFSANGTGVSDSQAW